MAKAVMNWYSVGVGAIALIVACLLWRRADKITRNQNEMSRFVFRGLAPDMNPVAAKASGVIVGLGGVTLIVLGLFGLWL